MNIIKIIPTVQDLQWTLKQMVGYYDPEKINIHKTHKTHAKGYSTNRQIKYRKRKKDEIIITNNNLNTERTSN